MTIDTQFYKASETFDVDIKEIYMFTPTVDQSFNPESENAQSGTAVAEAIADKANSADVDKLSNDITNINLHIDSVEENVGTVTEEVNSLSGEMVNKMYRFGEYTKGEDGSYLTVDYPLNFYGLGTPDGTVSTAAVNVEYVNGVVGDINAVLKQLVEVEE